LAAPGVCAVSRDVSTNLARSLSAARVWYHWLLGAMVSLSNSHREKIVVSVGIVVALALAAMWPERQPGSAKQSAE